MSSRDPKGFEQVFDVVGGHGKHQWALLVIVSFGIVLDAWYDFGYEFLVTEPEHWCQIEELEKSNWTVEEKRLLSIPRVDTKDDSGLGDETTWDPCHYYYLNYASLVSTSVSFLEAINKVDYVNATLKPCKHWNYKSSTYSSTIISQFDLVCSKRWLVAVTQYTCIAGRMIGSIALGILSDRVLGRRKVMLICSSVVIIFGFLMLAAPSFHVFLLCRFFISMGTAVIFLTSFILTTESCDETHRAFLTLLINVPYSAGRIILPVLAYNWKDWKSLHLIFAVFSASLVFYHWFLPESPRWLVTKGKLQQARSLLQKIGEINGREKCDDSELERIMRVCQASNEQEEEDTRRRSEGEENMTISCKNWSKTGCLLPLYTFLSYNFFIMLKYLGMLTRTAEIRKRSILLWILFLNASTMYHGLDLSSHFTLNPHLKALQGGLIEFFACLGAIFFVSKTGRRFSALLTIGLGTLCTFTVSMIPKSWSTCNLLFSILGNLFANIGANIGYLLACELYPTKIRSSGTALAYFCRQLGVILTSTILETLRMVDDSLATSILGSIGLIGYLTAVIFLPETRNTLIWDTVEEINTAVKKEKADQKDRNIDWRDVI